MPQEEFQSRLAAVRREMARRDLRALLVYGDNYSFADLCYLTNYFPKVRGGIAVVPQSGSISLLLNIGSRDVPFAKTLTYVEDVRASGQVGRDGAGLLKEKGLDRARVGVVDCGRGFPLPQLEEMKSAAPEIEWQENHDFFLGLRLRKSARELTALRAAGTVLAQVSDGARDFIKSGRKEHEVIADIDRLARDQGAEDIRIMAGPNRLRPPNLKTNGTVGEHWALYLAIQHERYWVESGRTYILSQHTRLQDAYQRAREIVGLMTAQLRAGAAVSDVDNTARTQLGEFYATAASYGLGNGIGLSQWEAPFLTEEEAQPMGVQVNPVCFEQDMAVALRVAFETEGKLVLFGDSFQVTSEGGTLYAMPE